MGNVVIGVIQLLTCGGFGIWCLLDLIIILCSGYTDGEGSYCNVQKPSHPLKNNTFFQMLKNAPLTPVILIAFSFLFISTTLLLAQYLSRAKRDFGFGWDCFCLLVQVLVGILIGAFLIKVSLEMVCPEPSPRFCSR